MPSNWPRCNRSHAGDQTGEGAIRATPLLWSIDLGVVAAKSPVSRARQRAMVIIIRREPPPLRIDGIVNLALNLLDQGSPQEALPLLETALALAPASARARLAKARALNDLGRASEIGFLLDGLQPSDLVEADAASLNDIANGLSRLREFAAALPLYQLCKSISAPSAPILHNEGGALVALGRREEALAAYDQALALQPDQMDTHIAKGGLLQGLERFEAAEAAYRAGLRIDPEHGPTHIDLAICLFKMGRLKEAWPEWEWRWTEEAPRTLSRPLWTGAQPLEDKVLLVQGEQGIGDILQFSRYLPLVGRMAKRLLVGCPQALIPLLSRIEGVDFTTVFADELPDFDLQVPFMSLGAAFKTEIDTLPASKGVITVAEKDEARWRARLGPKDAFRVGLAWSGNPIHRNDRNRSIAFARFKAVFEGLSEAEKIEFHILPNRVPEQEQAEVLSHPELTFHGEALHTFADAAALVQAMDLVISVDTSLAHLAGVLDRPAIVLLPTPCDWRWMAKREDSPWYPSLRLFRQETPGDWETVLARARQDLVKRVREARR